MVPDTIAVTGVDTAGHADATEVGEQGGMGEIR
jgi:hypothetical protein